MRIEDKASCVLHLTDPALGDDNANSCEPTNPYAAKVEDNYCPTLDSWDRSKSSRNKYPIEKVWRKSGLGIPDPMAPVERIVEPDTSMEDTISLAEDCTGGVTCRLLPMSPTSHSILNPLWDPTDKPFTSCPLPFPPSLPPKTPAPHPLTHYALQLQAKHSFTRSETVLRWPDLFSQQLLPNDAEDTMHRGTPDCVHCRNYPTTGVRWRYLPTYDYIVWLKHLRYMSWPVQDAYDMWEENQRRERVELMKQGWVRWNRYGWDVYFKPTRPCVDVARVDEGINDEAEKEGEAELVNTTEDKRENRMRRLKRMWKSAFERQFKKIHQSSSSSIVVAVGVNLHAEKEGDVEPATEEQRRRNRRRRT